jgi:filamentous hemagglutinin family protein
MSRRDLSYPTTFARHTSGVFSRRTLLAGASVIALVLAAPQGAGALQPGRTGSASSAVVNAATSAITSAQQAAAIAAQSQNSMARAVQAIQAMQAVQNAARQLATAGPNNLGADPNHPGLQLPDVPDGLGSGGLMPDSGATGGVANAVTTWVNANTPTQTTSNGQTTVSIQQTAPQALLNWTTFNVGKSTTVDFNQQGNAAWVALNRIIDPSGVPSQILGQIKADGQVLLINKSGIIFGGSSQINVHTLIATTLDLDPAVSNQLYLQNGLYQSPMPLGFSGSGVAVFDTAGSPGTGAVTVQPGAVIDITGKLTPTGDGGYVALLGAGGVSNAGTIATQNGQIILAADKSVTLITPLKSYVGVRTARQVLAGGGPVTNAANGVLLSNDGAITLAGSTISQFGTIEATTSVTRTGSISLSTLYGGPGNIVLGPNSLTAILPDESSGPLPTSTVNSSVVVNNNNVSAPYFQAVLQPQISIQASGSVDVQGNGAGLGGAFIKAPGAALTIAAGGGAGSTPSTVGTVLLEPGSSIDLSGLAGVTLPMSINTVSIKITTAEVADDPLAKNLIGKTVTVDVRRSGTRPDGFQWIGSPILDAAGFAGLVPESIDQLLTAGGSFTTFAKNFIQQPGAAINVSGGYVQYLGGFVNTTRLMGSDGRWYDIGSANPNIAYIGIAGGFTVQHMIQGQVDPSLTETWTGPGYSGGHNEPGYIAGANAGAISVMAAAPILAGEIVADVVAGDRQRAMAAQSLSTLAPSDQMPTGASLSITFANPGSGTYNAVLEPQADAASDPYGLSSFSFASASTWSPVLAKGVFPVFSDLLSNPQPGSISIKGANQLSMPADAALSVLPGGSITLDGVATLDGALNAPAGKISLTGFTYVNAGGPGAPPTPALIIGPDAVLNVRGLWVNDTSLSPDQLQGPGFVNGGSVSIATLAASNGPFIYDGVFTDVTQSIVLSPGSVIDVSSGGYVGSTGRLKTGSDGLPAGKGGSLTLTTYADGFTYPDLNGYANKYNVLPHGTNPDGSVNVPNQANVVLGGTIYAYGFDGGGTLTLQVPTIVIDGAAAQVTADLSTATASALAGQSAAPLAGFAVSDANAGRLLLPPSFFTGAFSQYTLSDIYGGTTVTAGTQLVLQQVNALVTGQEIDMPTGTPVRGFAPVGLLPDGLRKPVSLTLNSETRILVDRGARIVADPQATVTLNATLVQGAAVPPTTVLGSIVAPAGTIGVSGTQVLIGAGAVLDVSGVFVPNPQVVAYSTGSVLGGGSITLSALLGSLVVQPGAQFDLQGAAVLAASNLIQLPQLGLARNPIGQADWSNGGNLQLLSGQNIYFAGTVNAAGGAPLASGGTLSIVSSNNNAIVVEPAGIVAANLPAQGVSTPPGAFIGADTLNNSGFDSINLIAASTIAFGGSVNISIPGALTLSAVQGNFALLPASTGLLPSGVTDPARFTPASCGPACIPSIGGTIVNLDAGYVRMVGRGVGGQMAFPNVADGTLNVNARWIDLERGIGLDNVGNASFTSAGALRLLPDSYDYPSGGTVQPAFGGAMIAPGNLMLKAAEIYPGTNTHFLLMSSGTLASDSTIMISPNGPATTPLSAGGAIVLDAQTIVQNGTLWAPLGGITLGVQSVDQIPIAAFQFVTGNTVYNGPFVVTQNATLGTASLTSVSAAGQVIPYGYTIDGTTWYEGTPVSGSGLGLPSVLTAPPAKSIGIFSANVTTQPGAVLDLSGGGDIYATEFVAGTGGSRNVLTSYQLNPTTGAATPTYANGRQVYALVPTYQAAVAAYDSNFANNPYYSGLAIPAGSSPNSLPSANALAPGMSVTIAAGSGIPAGTYTLLPGMYATLPGAYRVVQAASNVNPATNSFTSADGSAYVVGTLTNVLTGARSSQSALFQIQSNAVWTQYSRINITSGTTFFRNLAVAANVTPPPLPIDGGVLTLGATNSLNLNGTNLFAPGTSDLAPGLVGGGGQVQISAANILILSSDQRLPGADCLAGSAVGCTGSAGYLVLDAGVLSRLGAASVLIGGTATVNSSGGETITARALNLEVATDAAHPLTGPELVLVSLAPTSPNASAHGLTVDAGSVILAVGTVPAGTDRNITIGANPVAQHDYSGNLTGYTAGITGDGSLLRVSNGTTVNVTRFFVPGQYTGPGTPPSSPVPLGAFSIAGATIDGGNALTLDTSGRGSLASDAILKAANYDLAASVIDIGGGSSGLVLSPALLQNFAGAVSVRLRSTSVINLYDAGGLQIGDPARPIGTLTFDSAGLYGQGGSTTIDAGNIDLVNSNGVTGTGIAGAGGTLTLNATATITEDAGAKSLGGFGQINFNAGQAIEFSGSGSLEPVAAGGTGTANILLSAPAIIVNSGATQSLTTLGQVNFATGAGTMPASVATNIGGALAVTAASISDTATIQALSGKVSLTATAGDVVLGARALIDASGSHMTILDVSEDAPGGNVRLTSITGNVIVTPAAEIRVAAAGNGYAGSLTIQAANTATLDGTFDGHAAFKDLGGNFLLQAGSLGGAGVLPITAGFTSSFAVQLGSGDITIAAGQTLASDNVLLVANSGSVIVNGTIDASAPNGGTIALYGTGVSSQITDVNNHTYTYISGGVTIGATAQLLARYQADDPRDPNYANGTSALVQNGGTITLGTTGVPTSGSYDTTGCGGTGCGYENVNAQIIMVNGQGGTQQPKKITNSGTINVASGAIFDVSGGPGGPNISNAGGSVIIRAPILTDNTVNVDFLGAVRGVADANGNAIGKGTVLNAYAVWSTKDNSIGAQHFDGIVDPAGWYDANGNLVAGTFTDPQGNTISYTPGNGTTASQLQAMLTNDIFIPTVGATTAAHTGFYGYVDPNTGNVAGTLPLFVRNFSLANTPIATSGTGNVHLRPEIDLINPSTGVNAINNGNITVATNWNLGAGSEDSSSGNITLYFRTASGHEPGTLMLSAVNNVNINATISDGFFLQYRGSQLPAILPPSTTSTSVPPTPDYWYQQELAALVSLGYNGFIDANGNLTFANYAVGGGTAPTFADMFGNGSYIPLSLLGPVTLQPPTVFTNPTNNSAVASLIDQYTQYYYQYTQLFAVYAKSTTYNEGYYAPPTGVSSYLPPAAPTTPDNYYNFQSGAQPGSGTDYVSQYQNYFLQVVGNVNQGSAGGGFAAAAGTDGCSPCIAYAAPFAPMAQLASSLQLGYSQSQPIVTTINLPRRLAGPITTDMIATIYAGALDAISNNPLVTNFDPFYGIGNVMNATSSSPLMTAAISGNGSFSYDFVAGAVFQANNALSVDPNAVLPVSPLSPTVTGNVTIDGHTSYADVLARGSNGPLTINIPTLVRTGTGSITIAAAGNVEFLDQTTPGAIYTAGAAATTPSDFNAPTVPARYTSNPNGLVSTPAWGVGGGAVTVTAGGSIIGVEMPLDANGSQTGTAGAATGQMWSDWYYHSGLSDGSITPFAGCAAAGSVACQTAAWVNYATFFQGFGALGGGNITLSAAVDIVDVGASLPETLVVGGGFTAADPPVATYYGGGNLRVTAGGNLLSSDFLVGRGTGLIQVGGAVQLDPSVAVPNTNYGGSQPTPIPLLLAVQDGFISVIANGSVTLGSVFDPAALPTNAGLQTIATALPSGNGSGGNIFGNQFTSFGASSGVSLLSVAGDVTALTVPISQSAPQMSLFVGPQNNGLPHNMDFLLPATLDLAALSGGIFFNKYGPGGGDIGNANLVPYPTQTGSDTGTVTFVAAGSIDLGVGLAMPDLSTVTTQHIGGSVNTSNYVSPLGVPLANLTVALHANDPNPVIIAAGQDIIGANASLTLIKPAEIEAGHNIYGAKDISGNFATPSSGVQQRPFTFVGQNNSPADITSIVAGNDLVGGSYALYGPGIFVLQAGRDMGPFQGIATLGNGSSAGGSFGSSVRPYLPSQGAELDVLFGVKPGINYAAAVAAYVDPAGSGAAAGISFLPLITPRLDQSLDVIATQAKTSPGFALELELQLAIAGLPPVPLTPAGLVASDYVPKFNLSPGPAWKLFSALAAVDRGLLVNRAFLDFLTEVAQDYNSPSSPYYRQYSRAYAAISTLFPAGYGYTDNASGGGSSGAAVRIQTGNLNTAASVLETQMGGDINILGPGGGITVGHSSTDTLTPSQEGILTLAGGTIRAYTDGSILVNQSRIMTEQGGNIDLFSANGDISAGEGPKTYVSDPVLSELCDVNGYCYVNPQGLVTGAGIAAVLTLPGQDPSLSNVSLATPHGIIDLAAAGARGHNINLVGVILNAFNIQTTGTVTGIPVTPPPNAAALAPASNANTATQQAGLPTQPNSNGQSSVMIVEIIGYGGAQGTEENDNDDDHRKK